MLPGVFLPAWLYPGENVLSPAAREGESPRFYVTFPRPDNATIPYMRSARRLCPDG